MMVDGIVTPPTQFTPLVTWQDFGVAVKKEVYSSVSAAMYEQIKLPAIKPSFFKSVNEVGPATAGAEELSAQYHIPHRMTVLDKPEWSGAGNLTLTGAWDIGWVKDVLIQPVYEVTIDKSGRVSVEETDARNDSKRNFSGSHNQYLDGELVFSQYAKQHEQVPVKSLLPGYKAIAEPWMFFRLAQLPALIKAKANIKKFKKVAYGVYADENLGLANTTIDLDNDGVADLLVSDVDVMSNCEKEYLQVVLVNVLGQWYLLHVNADSYDCIS
jgi:hypothetical protein